ncbi:MAG: 3-hydroxybutyryl-CoA dehydrogenase [Thermoleophilaceae bacterium]|jgi:3-hydroxybutyryl-CoA dehydrogenase|nr:3-hydroxybutyryl-CoA dehydrogenase [Thermoleophilaceae bacterium]
MTSWSRLAVIGAGLMGRGIAECGAAAGSEVLLYDADAAAIERAQREIQRSVGRAVERGRLAPDAGAQTLERIAFRHRLDDDIARCDAVIEAVPEQLPLKLAVFSELDGLAAAGALLASNTSGLSVTEIATATNRSSEVVGMHFFNPVPRMSLVEIVRGLETSEETIDRARALADHLGKEPVIAKDSPAFIASRVNAVIGNEAFFMLMEGVAEAEDIDRALKLGLNHPMGPFELVDLVGLDTRLHVLEHLEATLGEKYRPCPLLRTYVAAGRLGRKTGRGVYDYNETGVAA